MQKSKKNIYEYIAEIYLAMKETQSDIDIITNVLKNASDKGFTIWVLGNGGSLAIAQHFAQDLVKLRGMKAQAITCPSTITAYSNDDQFENCYSMPLKILRCAGDPVVIFSCSGSSRNYQNVVNDGHRPIISIIGTDGGFLKKQSSYSVHIKSDNYQVCESAFSIVADLINFGLESEK